MYSFLLFLLFALVRSQRSALLPQPYLSCNGAGVELEVKAARINVGNQITFTSRIYHVGGVPMFPGPTIHGQAGQVCNITVINSLPGPPCSLFTNQPVCPQTLGLHFHGSHVSPTEDDVFWRLQPGERHTWSYNLKDIHMMGTHWYHPHIHGSSELQVEGGLHGMLLVEPAASYVLPSDLKVLYDNAILITLSNLLFRTPNASLSGPFVPLSYQMINDEMPGNLIDPDIVITGNDDIYTLNGQYQPYIDIAPEQATLLRILHAVGSRVVEFELVDPNKYCTLQVIARDGVFHYTPYQTVEGIFLNQATRADIAIKCSAAAAGQTIDVRIFPDPSRDKWFGVLNRPKQDLAFSFRVGMLPNPVPFPTSQATFPDYLASLVNYPNLSTGSYCPHNELNITFGVIRELTNGNAYGTINGVVFRNPYLNKTYADTLCLDHVFEEVVQIPAGGNGGYGSSDPSLSPTGVHPYHVHISPFQLMVGDGSPNGAYYRKHEWRDVIGIIFDSPIKFRYHPFNYVGDYVFHCHIYAHGDRGMMGLWNVRDANNCPPPQPCATVPNPTPTPTEPPTPTPTPTPTTEPNPPSGSGVNLVNGLLLLVLGVMQYIM